MTSRTGGKKILNHCEPCKYFNVEVREGGGWLDEDEAIAKERRKQEAERWDAIVEEEANEKL